MMPSNSGVLPTSTECATPPPPTGSSANKSVGLSQLRSICHALPFTTIVGIATIGAALLWSYWPTWEDMAHQWAHNPVYSHGYLVPVFALILLWSRRQKLKDVGFHPNWLGGCFLLSVAVGIRLAGAYFYFPWLDTVSLLPCLAGLCLLLAGRDCFAWSWPAIAFLFFMVPLPYSLETGMKQPLQRLATQGSTYVLQTLGCPAFDEGNIIVLGGKTLGVEEACSGLSMLLVFFALATAVALIVRRPLWEKGIILVSAIPIAVAANVGRIVATGVLYQLGKSQEAQLVFHDLAGWLMMPLGLVLIGLEIMVLNHLIVTAKAGQPLSMALTHPALGQLPRGRNKASKRRRRQRA
jgi:exosortase